MDEFEELESMDSDIHWPIEIEQYERRIYDLKQLIEISKGLNSTLEYNTLIDSILLTCMGQMQLLDAGIFLKKGIGFDNFSLHRNYKGFEIDHSREYELLSKSKTVEFLKNKFKCYRLDELCGIVGDDSALSVLKLLNPVLIVPLMSRGELNGIIILGGRINKQNFTETELEFMLNIGALAGIAIHNARLYEMATTDMMTRLKIHHYFQTIIVEEIERAIRYNKPLSLIMADLDHFKDFNDMYGHIAGDIVLKNVAQIFKDNIRLIDIAARYGGEEFAVILPNTDINEALMIAERIRENVKNKKIHYEEKELRVTLSIGIAQFDSKLDRSKRDLINRADKALYASKKNGRNRVSFL